MSGHEDETVEPQTVEELAQQQAHPGNLAPRDDMMAKTFIALVHKQGSGLDDVAAGGETNREIGAETAYENWYNDQVYLYNRDKEAEDRIARYDAANPVVNSTIAGMMKAQLEALLTRLNDGNVLNDDAQELISNFMDGGAEAFGDAMRDNRSAVANGRQQRQANIQAGTADPNAQAFHGVMAVLMGNDPANWPNNYFNNIDISDVQLNPMQQAEATEIGMFTAMRDFVTGDISGGGAETALARLNGVQWGAFDRDAMEYEGINPIVGLGHQPDFADAMVKFADLDRPVGTYRLNDTSPEVPANIDGLFTQAMEGRTVNGIPMLELATDEARADWNKHLAGGLALKLSGRDLQERMQEFAVARDDITMASEVLARRARAPEIAARVEDMHDHHASRNGLATPFEDPGSVTAAQLAVERTERLAVEAAAETADDHVERNAPDADSSYEISELAVGADIEVAMAYPVADNIMNFESVRAEGDMRMGTVPVVMAGLQQTQTPMPDMGYGVQTNGPAANSLLEPSMGLQRV